MDLNPFHLLHHSHAQNPHLKTFERNGKFGVGVDENTVPQWSFNTKAEADDYIKLAQDYDADAAKTAEANKQANQGKAVEEHPEAAKAAPAPGANAPAKPTH
jgi:hypothetical protein